MLMVGGIILTFLLGFFLHYLYEWSGRSIWVAFIAPTNESLFEHLKILLTPYLLWTLVEYAHYGQFMHAFIPAKVIGLYTGMFLIIFLYLLYAQLVPTPSLTGKILIFGSAVAASFVIAEFFMTLSFMDSEILELIFDGILVLTVLVFAVFTVYAPHHWLFQEK